MFVLTNRRLFLADATAIVPSAETAGEHTREAFRLRFELIDDDEMTELARFTPEDLADPVTAEAKNERRVLRRVIVGWEDVVDGSKEPIPFDEDVLEMALRLRWFRLAAYAAYRHAIESGEAARGN